MANNLKVILKSGINNNDLTLTELCSVIKQIIILEERKLYEISEEISISYAGLVRLLTGVNTNPTVKTLDTIAGEIGYTLSFNLKKKKCKKGKPNKGDNSK